MRMRQPQPEVPELEEAVLEEEHEDEKNVAQPE